MSDRMEFGMGDWADIEEQREQRRAATMTAETRTAHTPGPWKIGQTLDLTPLAEPDEVWEVRPILAGTEIIALASDADANPADARLIAAAPELLAALIDLLDSWSYDYEEYRKNADEETDDEPDTVRIIWENAEAAIDKATR